MSLAAELNDRAVNAANALNTRISHIAQLAIAEWVARAEEANGGPFPDVGPLPMGRPRKEVRRKAGVLP